MRKAKQSRPTREEILEGIGYEPLTFPASLRVPEALRAEEDRAMQDYIVAWTQGLWDFVQAHENAPDPSTKRAQGFDESRHPRDERGRFADLASRPRQSEQKFKPELYVTWVAGSADLSYIIANVLRAWRTRRGRRSYACSIWIPEVWMVKNVKSLSAEL
jgi:hypothetical protein